MPILVKQSFLLLLTLVETITIFSQPNDETQIRTAFESYKKFILNDNGKEASQLVDSNTIHYYGYILNLVKQADSATVAASTIMDKFMIFTIRHRTPRELILSTDGKGIFEYAVKAGMVGKGSVQNNTVGKISIIGSTAKGELLVNGKKSPLNFVFNKEKNIWKLDLTVIFPSANMAFKQLVKESGQGENEFLFTMLAMITGKEPGSEIWQPIK